MTFKKFLGPALTVSLLTGCAGMQRGCTVWNAERYGGNWVVAQMGGDGKPALCWLLRGASVTNEPQSDGIYWLDRDGDLVHVAGWVDRVQVSGGDYGAAARKLRIADVSGCTQP